ncbi:MAG: ribonuclease PH [Spirochaetia bacterium]|nr:ribonuclease PH [Spirochaetia bacterium]MCF7940891.1 ribonuclease PH [Spirochaetia bacterium]
MNCCGRMTGMRDITIERNIIKYPQGSCLISFGDTKVICTATISNGVPPFLTGTGKGWVTAEYAMLPGSTGGGRKRRDGAKRDGRSTEIQRLIGRTLRSAVHLERLGEVSITIDCDVLQADGGTRTAAVTGGWVALYDALRSLAKEQGTSGAEHYLQGQVAAVSVGKVDGQIICDLDYAHDSRAEVDMNVVKRGEALVEVQGTGEQGVFSRKELNTLLDAADIGIDEIMDIQRQALGI